MIRSLLLSAILLAPLPAFAHKIIADVFPAGTEIEGELGFSNGDMAVDQLVEIFDEAGNKLGEATTDADGFFTFTPTEPITHIFRANMGAGHVAEMTMDAADVAPITGREAAVSETTTAAAAEDVAVEASANTTVIAALSDEERDAIAAAVRDEMRPLRRAITAYQEKKDFQQILGGMGYIVGLFGFGFFIAARRKLAEAEGKS
ncbi:cobalt ABC transporter permease [Cochlodiniinecator piscidefendens]|uniref:cobalt ABC transporter permease n=1 Tax=Cochlodiniinecator piscidefendens TaxID=2715756 RepID=UPI0014090DDF|nr:cobalt ABC transporter permease [Cochlodiniinecator piscidefendens]